ncbi:hypothetical protein H6G76_31975 [Nostoc sp. FACHB-152]|nr:MULTISPECIES: hypothetical protein [unclassified Nostoc]MBD2451656.1 hypothetical protein [Nostoc sp. FACHB-152]MBD2472760.1 hypothetical protein [Nostoc sp. FACHB-145]
MRNLGVWVRSLVKKSSTQTAIAFEKTGTQTAIAVWEILGYGCDRS